jgi:hypothetical protein
MVKPPRARSALLSGIFPPPNLIPQGCSDIYPTSSQEDLANRGESKLTFNRGAFNNFEHGLKNTNPTNQSQFGVLSLITIWATLVVASCAQGGLRKATPPDSQKQDGLRLDDKLSQRLPSSI